MVTKNRSVKRLIKAYIAGEGKAQTLDTPSKLTSYAAVKITERLLETSSKVSVEDNFGNTIFNTRLASLKKLAGHLEAMNLNETN